MQRQLPFLKMFSVHFFFQVHAFILLLPSLTMAASLVVFFCYDYKDTLASCQLEIKYGGFFIARTP
jgi:hypothetical protein